VSRPLRTRRVMVCVVTPPSRSQSLINSKVTDCGRSADRTLKAPFASDGALRNGQRHNGLMGSYTLLGEAAVMRSGRPVLAGQP